jgi:hypothetical protein
VVPNYRAVVIGINDYQTHGGAGWNKLATAKPDAQAMADLLSTKYGFKVTSLLDAQATRGAIIEALDDLVALGPNDACLVYFAGHGFYDEALSEGYWIPSDAKRTEGARPAKEDWIWNSTITKIIGASAARHILVIADSCYGGSLFRGDEAGTGHGDIQWYRRAIVKPSRYLIASGDVEPVPDTGGAQHSVFAQQLINFLTYTDMDVFSASDMGMSLREKVTKMTGQMVQMGPLAVAGHGGGEFIFIKPKASDNLSAMDVKIDTSQPTRSAGGPPAAPADRQQSLRDALMLGGQGATNAAQRLLAATAGAAGDDRLVRAVTEFLDQERRSKALKDLDTLIATLQQRKAARPAGQPAADLPRPRIVACIGPDVRNASAESESLAMLYRIALRSEMEALGRVQLVEREALDQVLKEMNLGSSELADSRAAVQIGKLLPAGLLLLGDILPVKNGEKLYLRLVDTETSRIVASFADEKKADEDLPAVCRRLAGLIVKKAVQARPLRAPAVRKEAGRIEAGIGAFHGAAAGMRFEVVERTPGAPAKLESFREKVVGAAQLATAGDESSEFTVEWAADAKANPPKEIWVREIAEL